jgi:hypothetical protein
MKETTKTRWKGGFKTCFKNVFVLVLWLTCLVGCVMPVDKPVTTPTTSLLTLLAPSATVLPSPTPLVELTVTPRASPTAESSAPRTTYTLKVQFDYARHHLAVNETVTYFNRSAQPISKLVLVIEPNRTPGVFQLDSLTWVDGTAIPRSGLKGASLTVALPQPLAPGNSVTLILNFQLNLPQRNGILGYGARQTNLGDWYPFLPYYQSGTGWLVYTPTGLGEHLCYDMADFVVDILPSDPKINLVISASAQAEGDSQTGYHYQLRAARNFTWSASQQMEALTDTSGKVKLFVTVFPEDKTAGEMALKSMGEALQIYSDLFGAYPHASLTMVEGDFFDGMEYDGFTFLDQNYFIHYAGGPEAYLVTLSAHETAHQWWYGLVGNDQAMEPWLDEALATYSEVLFYERQYPNEVNWWWNFRVIRFNPTGWVNTTIYDYDAFRPYVNAVYLRGVLFMQALRKQMGDQEFLAFLKDYATRYRQGWVSGADFFNVLGDHTQQNLDALIGEYFKKP